MDLKQKFDIRPEAIVPEYYSSNQHIRKIFFDRFQIALSYLQKINAKNILDAGCGDGLFTSKIIQLKNVFKVVGVDFNIHTDELNNKYPAIKFLRADLLQLPFDNEFDAVVCLDVLEHFENAEDVLFHLKKALKDNGYLIVSGPVESFWYKLGRLAAKGSFSQETGPGAGKHYNNIFELNKEIQKQFRLITTMKVKFFIIHLFDVNLYQKI